MDTAGKVSVPALRALTYCFLIKAIVSMAMCACTVANGFVMTHPDREIPGLIVVFVIAQTVRLLNSIMCILSLANVTALSKRFANAQAFIITGVVIESAILLLVGVKAQMAAQSLGKEAELTGIAIVACITVRRILKGAGFMQIMKGFGEALKKDDLVKQAEGAERLGYAYLLCSIAGALLTLIFKPGVAVNAAFYLSWAVMDLLMYRRASSAAFSIWRERAFNDSK